MTRHKQCKQCYNGKYYFYNGKDELVAIPCPFC